MTRTLLFSFVFLFSLNCLAQPEPPPHPDSEESGAVLAVVLKLFDGMREADPVKVATTFSSGATMQRITVKDGKSVISPPSSSQGFVDYVGSGLDQKNDEPIWDTQVHVDGDLASVWTKYAFYLGGKLHHCGVENFLLHKENGEWKIFHLVDTSETEGCEVPDKIKASSEF